MYKKTITLAALILSTLILTITQVSAGYKYYHPGYVYSYPTYEESYQIFPKFQNLPSITNTISNKDREVLAYTRNYQGRIIEKTTKYDEITLVGKRGRLTRTISASTTERFIGPSEYVQFGSESSQSQNQQYTFTPQNPSYYDGGLSWKSKDTYEFRTYGRDSYTKPYYYSPRYDYKRDYYNWRY